MLSLFAALTASSEQPVVSSPPPPTCTCEEAEKSVLAHEFAYRSGICEGSPKDLGADDTTTTCLYAVHSEYNEGGAFNGAEPEVFNASTASQYPVFRGVRHVRLPAGEVTDRWSCSVENGCGDCDPKGATPQQCSDERGYAYLWIPRGANSSTPRVLYVHGGSWLYNSPETGSYAPFCAMIAKTTGMPVLAFDYTLAPVGNFSVILAQAGHALHWLATHDPLLVALRGDAAAATTPLHAAPMLFIAGDSSGGGSAASALLAQSSAEGLPNAAGAHISGGVLFSPWLNLPYDTPSYVSQVFKLEDVPTAREHLLEKCTIPGLDPHAPLAKVSIGGDVAFPGYPHSLSASFAANGETYAGSREMMTDPIASPMKVRSS